jgi:FdhD protein
VPRVVWRLGAAASTAPRNIPEETPVAFSYEGASYAVMMATPADLEDFALGLSLNEGIVSHPAQIERLEIAPGDAGVVLRMSLAAPRKDAFWARRRRLAGPSGCGLCGIESIEDALRPCPVVTAGLRLMPRAVMTALREVQARQTLGRDTRAVHAAGFWHPERGCLAVREDVGRHNALDKLAGALVTQGVSAGDGVVVLTSRISVELVQKAAAMGAPVLVAVSAPTALAVRTAEAAGITLVAIAREDGFEVFTHPQRLLLSEAGPLP